MCPVTTARGALRCCSRGPHAAALVTSALALLACTACTTVRIVDATGSTIVKRSFGIARIMIAPSSRAVVSADVVAFGYVSTPLGVAVGFEKGSVLMADQNCRVVFFIRSTEQAQFVRNALRNIAAPNHPGGDYKMEICNEQ